MNVAAQPIERDSHRAPLTSRFTKRSRKLRASFTSLRALAGLYLNEDAAQRDALSNGEAVQCFLLRLNAQP